MSKQLNFNNVTKRYLTVTFSDEKSTTIMVGLPTKAILTELIDLNSRVKAVDNDFDILDELYEVCAKIMSRNKAGMKITREFIEDTLDFDDIVIFLRDYTSFISEVVSSKN